MTLYVQNCLQNQEVDDEVENTDKKASTDDIEKMKNKFNELFGDK